MIANQFAADLADSGMWLQGNVLHEVYNQEPAAVTFVPADEDRGGPRPVFEMMDDDQGCRCCCCTGECRQYEDYAEDAYYDARGEYTESDRRRDEFAAARWQRAVQEGTLPDGYSSLEDFGYVGRW